MSDFQIMAAIVGCAVLVVVASFFMVWLCFRVYDEVMSELRSRKWRHK